MPSTWSAERKILGGFGVALLVLCIVAGLSIWLTLALLGDLQAVSDRNDALQAIREFRSAMRQMNSDARLFAANGSDATFTDWQKQCQETFDKAGRLQQQFRSNTNQLARIEAITDSLRERIDQTHRDSDRAAIQRIWSGDSFTLIGNYLQEMELEEQNFLARRNDKATAGAFEAFWTIGSASVLAVVMVAGAAALVMRDMRGRRRASEELERARRAAEAASIAKSAFLANMSHELRTPLTSIMGYADLLLEPDSTPIRRQEFLQTMRRSSEHLLTLINDILDVSKIEAGRMTVEKVECRTADVLVDIDSLMRSRATDKGIDFALHYATPIPERVRTDPTRLRQILMNLVGNAVKFTDEGGVRIVLSYEPIASVQVESNAAPLSFAPGATIPPAQASTDEITPAGQTAPAEAAHETHRLIVDVIDTGVGIAADQLHTLFQPFTQADVSTTRRFGGTGLGLSISRRLAQMLGGDLTVQSRLQIGSTFRLTLPMQMAGDQMLQPGDARGLVIGTAPPAEAPPLHLDVRILLAEDGAENREVILLHLRHAGCRVAIVENGQQAYDAAMQASHSGKPFDVVLMDMQMPVMDGYTATKKLRTDGYKGIIIALTAHAMKEDREMCLRAGCDEYAAKPVDIPALLRMIARFCGQSDAVSLKVEIMENSVLRNLARKYCEAIPQALENLRDLARRQDTAALAAAVHKLIGTTGAYGFESMTQEARTLETLLKNAPSPDALIQQIQCLETAANSAREMLDSIDSTETRTPQKTT